MYEALDERVGRKVAVKVLRREVAGIPGVARRFLLEARAAAAVKHPGIARVIDIGEAPGEDPYLVMELVEGDDLAAILERKRRLDPDLAAAVCLHMLDALEAVHRAGIVHRDLKPANVVLSRNPGDRAAVRILDFGLARVPVHAGSSRLTAEGAVVGTPHYASPEQARASPDVDARADIYAVGVILFEMATGRVPFDGDSDADVMTKVLREPFPSPRSIRPSLSPELERVILRATARDPADRFATAADFAAALRALPWGDGADGTRADDSTTSRRLRDIAASAGARAARPGSGGATPLPVVVGGSRAMVVLAVVCAALAFLSAGPLGLSLVCSGGTPEVKRDAAAAGNEPRHAGDGGHRRDPDRREEP